MGAFCCLLFLQAGVSIASSSAPEFSSYQFHSYHDSKRFTFTITSEHQAECPTWDPAGEANPPVSAAKALELSNDFIATVETMANHSWALEDLSLINKGGWLWKTRFRLTFRGRPTGGPPVYMDCYILMDATVIQPVVTPYQPGTGSRQKSNGMSDAVPPRGEE